MSFYFISKGSLVFTHAVFLLGLFAAMAAPGLFGLRLAKGQSTWIRVTAFIGPLIAMSIIISILILDPFFSGQGTSLYMPDQSLGEVDR